MQEKLPAAFQLQKAIDKLSIFASTIAEKQSGSFASKTLASMRNFLDPDDNLEESIRGAVDVIQRQRLLIQKLQNGSPSDQKLVEAVNQAVGAYNEWCKKAQNSKRRKMKHFFKRQDSPSHALPNIELPQSLTVRRHYPAKTPALFKKHAFSSSSVQLNPQLTDLFHMKALALLEHYNIASNVQARNHVKQTPILTLKEEGNSNYLLKQIFMLFPGQTITITGNAALNDNIGNSLQLFPETFSVSLESVQTGFPHPLQRTGWALGPSLIPECPQRINLLGNLSEFFQNKKFIVTALQPGGQWIESVKRLLKLKKQAFTLHQTELLTLHRTLAHTLSHNPQQKQCVDNFFDDLETKPQAFEQLAEIYQILRDNFLIKPYSRLLEIIFNEKGEDFSHYPPPMRYQMTKQLLNQALKEAYQEVLDLKLAANPTELSKWEFIESLGYHLGTASKAVILQHLSEDLMFPPPSLNTFEKQLQVATYSQIADFFYELKLQTESITDVYKLMKDELNADIALFQGISNNGLIINETLEKYYRERDY